MSDSKQETMPVKSMPKFPRTAPPYRVYWCWDISYVCNYKCSYCIIDTWRQTTYLTPEEWKTIWDSIYELYGSTHIRFSGGEPTVYPDFWRILRYLGEHHTLNITTNLSFDVEAFVREIKPVADKARLVVSASYHPEFVEAEDFIKRILYLKENGICASASMVSWPAYLKNAKAAMDMMQRNGIQFLIIPLQGTHFGKQYPESYTDEERVLLQKLSVLTSNPVSKVMADFKLQDHPEDNKARLCRMGQNAAVLRPNGDAYRCCCFEKAAYLGNIIDGTFKLLDEPAYCGLKPCKCYKAMLVGDEERFSGLWNWAKHKAGTYYEPAAS